MNLLIQDAVATSLAIAAVAVIVRRLVGILSPPPSQPLGCAVCPSCPVAASTRQDQPPAGDAARRPMVLIRSRKSA